MLDDDTQTCETKVLTTERVPHYDRLGTIADSLNLEKCERGGYDRSQQGNNRRAVCVNLKGKGRDADLRIRLQELQSSCRSLFA